MKKNPELLWLTPNDPLPTLNKGAVIESPLDGLIAAGGGLSVLRLQEAYGKGMFPWFSERQPVLWWSPDPRMVLQPSISSSIAPFAKLFNTLFSRKITKFALIPHLNLSLPTAHSKPGRVKMALGSCKRCGKPMLRCTVRALPTALKLG